MSLLRFLSLLIFYLLILKSGVAQFQYNTPVKLKREFGIDGGLNWNTIKVDTVKYAANQGYQFGLYYRTGDDLWLQAGLSYFHFATENVEIPSQSLSYSSIVIPVLVGWRIDEDPNENFGLNLFGGVNLGYVLKVQQNGAISSGFNNFQFDLTGGAGFDLYVVRAGVAYAYGLNSVLDFYKSHPSYLYIFMGIAISDLIHGHEGNQPNHPH